MMYVLAPIKLPFMTKLYGVPMKNIYLLLLLFVPLFNVALAGTISQTSGKVVAVRSSTQYHELINQDSERETLIQLETPLDGCDWLGVKSSDSVFVSILLMAQTQSKPVRVWYYSDKFSPIWGDSVCQAITIEAK